MKDLLIVSILITLILYVINIKDRKPKPAAQEAPALTPPTEKEIIRRVACVRALIMRTDYEYQYQENVVPTMKAYYAEAAQKINDWLFQEELFIWQSNEEKQLFSKEIGTWTRRDLINASWRAESLGIFLWALSLITQIPKYDEKFNKAEILKNSRLLKPSNRIARRIKLRSSEEITKAKDTAKHWLWRSKTNRFIADEIPPPSGYTFEQLIKISAEKGFQAGMNEAPLADDFPAYNKAYRDLTQKEYHTLSSIAIERHHALAWLCGLLSNWDQQPTEL